MYITTTYLWDIDCNNDRIREGVGSWSGGSLLFYTADTYTTKKKYTLISCDNSLFAYQYVSCSRNFSFLSFFLFFLFRLFSLSFNQDRSQENSHLEKTETTLHSNRGILRMYIEREVEPRSFDDPPRFLVYKIVVKYRTWQSNNVLFR